MLNALNGLVVAFMAFIGAVTVGTRCGRRVGNEINRWRGRQGRRGWGAGRCRLGCRRSDPGDGHPQVGARGVGEAWDSDV